MTLECTANLTASPQPEAVFSLLMKVIFIRILADLSDLDKYFQRQGCKGNSRALLVGLKIGTAIGLEDPQKIKHRTTL